MNGYISKRISAAAKSGIVDDDGKPMLYIAKREHRSLLRIKKRHEDISQELMASLSLLTHHYPSGIRKVTDAESPHFGQCYVTIDTPAGQCSWRIREEHIDLFVHLPQYTKPWDGEVNVAKDRITTAALLKQHNRGEE